MRAITASLVRAGDGFVPDRAVVIDGDSITSVVPRSGLPEGTEVEDWGHVAIVPGTINAHGHAFQNLLKGFADDRRFDSWRDDVLYPFSQSLDSDDIEVGALFAFAEAVFAGVAATVGFFF